MPDNPYYTAFAYNDESQDDYASGGLVDASRLHTYEHADGINRIYLMRVDDNRKVQYIPEKLILEARSMTQVDSALVYHITDTGNMVADDDSDSLLLTMYTRDDDK